MTEGSTRDIRAAQLHITIQQHRAALVRLAREARDVGLTAAKRDLQAAAKALEDAIANLAVGLAEQAEQPPLPQLDSDPPPSR